MKINNIFSNKFAFTIQILLFGLLLNAQVLITEETFDESNGSITGTMSNGEPWEANTFGHCADVLGVWEVQNGDFVCSDIEGFNCCDCAPTYGFGACGDNKNIINFGPINISAFQGVSLEFSVDGTPNMECGNPTDPADDCLDPPIDGCTGGNDQIVFYYSIDGGPFEVFEYYCGSSLCYQINPQVCNLQGNNLNIRLELGNQSTNEFYYIHSLSVYGYTQSPAEAIATPSAICSGQSIQLDEIGGNAVSWSWSGPGSFTSSIKNPVVNNAQAGTYTVTITDANGCQSTDQVVVTSGSSPTASLSGTFEFCPGDCHQLNLEISGGTEPYVAGFLVQAGPINYPFTVQGYSVNNQMTICYSGSGPLPVYDPGSNTVTVPTWITGTGTLFLNSLVSADGCAATVIDPNNTTLTFKGKNEINQAGPLQVCDDDFDGVGVFELTSLDNTLTGGQSNVTVNWFEDSNCTTQISNPGSYTSSGTTVYTFISHDQGEKCNSDTIGIQLILIEIPNPGLSNNTSICTNENCVNFWIYLGPEAVQTGIWNDDNGTGIDLALPDCVDFTGVAAGTYTFTYTTQDPGGLCPEASATLTIEVFEPGNPGNDNNDVFCGAPSNPVDIVSYLNNNFDPGGTWTNTGSFNMNDPSRVDMSGAVEGTYYFYYEIENAPCSPIFSTITIQIIYNPNPGINSTVPVCNDGQNTIVDLDAALGPHDLNGFWSDDNFTGVNLSNPTSVDFNGVPPGSYNFTYTIPQNGSCPQVEATVTVIVSAGPNAGTNGSESICKGSTQLINLFLYLGNHDSGGSWTQLSGETVSITDPNNVSFADKPQGSYNFQYSVTSGCGTVAAIVTIVVNPAQGAGDGYNLTICQNSTINLYDSLKNYLLGGYWIDENNFIVSNPNSVLLDQPKTYTFKYIFIGSSGCPNDTSIATIVSIAGVNAGTDGSLVLCQGATGTVNLFSYIGLGYTGGGFWWNVNNGTVTPSSSTVDFSASPVGLDTFMYIISGNCGIDTSYVIVNIATSTNAGTDYSATVCLNSTVNLFENLKNYSPGGFWVDANNVKLTDPMKIILTEIKTYTFKYIIPATGGCNADTALAQITVLLAPYAGIATDFSICQGSVAPVNFFDHLSGNYTTSGTWKFNSVLTIPNPKNYNMSTLPPGTYNYAYIVAGSANCPGDTAYLKVTILQFPNAGTDAQNDVCNSNINNILNLDNLIGVHDFTGIWNKPQGNPVNINNPKNVNFNNIPPGTYYFTYKINSNGICPPDSAIVTVNVFKKLNAGIDKTLSFCETDNGKVKILDELKPDPNTSYVIEDIQQTQSINNQTLEIDLSKLNVGTFKFNLIVGQNHICGTDSSLLTINIVKAKTAGNNNVITVCNDETNINLDNLLGTHDQGGTWVDMDNSGVQVQPSAGKNVSFLNTPRGKYRFMYKHTTTAPCPESSAIITVTVNPVSKFTLTREICSGESIIVNGKTYNLTNPTGTEIVNNSFGCDSIITIDLKQKQVSANVSAEDENCFGYGKFIVESLSGTNLPATLTIDGSGSYQITNIPFTVQNLAGGNYTYDITNANGCNILNKSFAIKDFIPFDIDIDVDQLEDSYKLTVTTNIIPDQINWTPTEGLSCDDCLITIVKPIKNQQYIIEITDKDGCKVLDTIELKRIINTDLDIPNVFSPDDDGKNDRFYARCDECDYVYTMYIFDRWGEKVFYAKDIKINDNTAGWDGRYKEKKLNPGVYVYVIEIDKGNGEKEVIPGDLLLIR